MVSVVVATKEFVVVPVMIPVAIMVGTRSGRPYMLVVCVVVPMVYVPVCSVPGRGVTGVDTLGVVLVAVVLIATPTGVVPPGFSGVGIITMPGFSSAGKNTDVTDTTAVATPVTACGTKRAR